MILYRLGNSLPAYEQIEFAKLIHDSAASITILVNLEQFCPLLSILPVGVVFMMTPARKPAIVGNSDFLNYVTHSVYREFLSLLLDESVQRRKKVHPKPREIRLESAGINDDL